MADVEINDDFEFDAAENLNDEQWRLRLPPPRPRKTLNHFVESVLRSPPSVSSEEALSRYTKTKKKRNLLLKQGRVAQKHVKHFINKINKIEEELNRSDTELAELEPVVLVDILNPN